MQQIDPSKTYPLVYGETTRGVVTLTDVIFNYASEIGSVRFAVFGHYLNNSRNITSLGFTLDILHEWAFAKHGFKLPVDKYLSALETYSCVVNDITCTLNISVGTSSHVTEGERIFTNTSFYLKSETGKNISDFIDIYIGTLQLLRIIMGRNLKPLRISTLIGKSTYDIFLPVLSTEEFGGFYDHLFHFPYIRDKYSQIFSNWFKFYFENKYLIEIFMESLKTKIITISDFFVFASVLDGLYQSKYSGERKYKSRIRKVLSIFSGKYSNLEEFIDKVDEFRHANFHILERKELDRITMNKLSYDLHYLIRIIIMNNVGVEIDDRILNIKFQFLKIIKIEMKPNLE